MQREIDEVAGDDQRVDRLERDRRPEDVELELGLAGKDQVRQPGKYEASGDE